MIDEKDLYISKEKIDDIIKHNFSMCCENDEYFFVKIVTDNTYDNCIYVIDKSCNKIYWMYFTDFLSIESETKPISKERIEELI